MNLAPNRKCYPDLLSIPTNDAFLDLSVNWNLDEKNGDKLTVLLTARRNQDIALKMEPRVYLVEEQEHDMADGRIGPAMVRDLGKLKLPLKLEIQLPMGWRTASGKRRKRR